MTTQLLYDEAARTAVGNGIDKLSDAVKVTMGPKGRNVAFTQTYDVPLVTNDGVTIAKQIELEDVYENMGSNIVKSAAMKTNEQSGDGTTASIVLSQAIIKEGMKNIAAGANPIMLKRGLDNALEIVVNKLKKMSIPLNDRKLVQSVATISGNNDAFIGEMIADAFDKIGLDGVVTVEDSQLMDTTMKYSKGIHTETGYLSPYFINNENNRTCELSEPYILMVEGKIGNFKDIVHVLEQTLESGASLLIICQDMDDAVTAALANNVVKASLKASAIKCPGYGDTRKRNMEIIALMTDATVVTEETGMKLESCGLEVCGRAKRVVIDKESTLIQEPPCSNIEEIEKYKNKLKEKIAKETADYELEKLNISLALLSGGIAVITVGGVSELEMFERKYRMEDAVCAVYAARDEGVVAGGGKALLSTISDVQAYIDTVDSDERTGALILKKALEEPVRQIAINAGVDDSVVIDKLINSDDKNFGFDAKNLEYCDMFEKGILDPVKVIRCSLENAVSIAGMFLTANAAVADPKSVENKTHE